MIPKKTKKGRNLFGRLPITYMTMKSILITEQLKEMINKFLGAELIPACAIGGELAYVNGNLLVKTFHKGSLRGYRKLDSNGELVNIITEFK